MARRATSLGPKPSLFYLFCFYLFLFFFFLLCCFFVSLSLLLLEKPCFPPLKRAFLCIFFLCVPLFLFCLVSLSLSLCLSLVLFLFPSLLCFFFSVSGSCFSFLFSLLSSFKLFFGFCCSASCFVLNHNLSFVFALHLLSSFSSCFLFCLLWFFFFDFWKPNKKHLQKKRKLKKNSKNEKCRKKDT